MVTNNLVGALVLHTSAPHTHNQDHNNKTPCRHYKVTYAHEASVLLWGGGNGGLILKCGMCGRTVDQRIGRATVRAVNYYRGQL